VTATIISDQVKLPEQTVSFFFYLQRRISTRLPAKQLHPSKPRSITMKLSTVAAVISFGLPSLTSAWRLRLYRNAGYQVLIEDQSDPFSHACTNLDPQLRGQTSSMHWESEGALGKLVYVAFIPAATPY
jgi:hypothetical protein